MDNKICCEDLKDAFSCAGGCTPGICESNFKIAGCDGAFDPAINFCPWCGVSLAEFKIKKEA